MMRAHRVGLAILLALGACVGGCSAINPFGSFSFGTDGGGGDTDGGTDGGGGDTDGGMSGCPSGSYDVDGDPATACVAWTGCEAGEYVSAAGTATSDQTCAGCVSGMFSESLNASECVAWATCVAGTFVTAEGSARADRMCAECESGTSTTGENQSMCVSADMCTPGTVQLEPATATMAAVCETCVVGEYCAGGDVARSGCNAAGDGTWDHDADPSTACAERTACAAGSAVALEGDATTDRTCEVCASGSFSTTTNAASCSAWGDCAAGTYASNTPSAMEDRACSACASGQYSAMANATSCSAWSTCSAGSYVSNTPSATGDRTCSACASGQYSTTANATSCSAWTTCSSGTYASNTPSATTDRTCADCATIANCASGLTCTSASDQTCGVCVSGYVSEASRTVCALPWPRQFGTAPDDHGQSVAVDGSGNVYVAGYTWGALEGPNAGGWDVFVRKYSSAGAVLWTRQFGTTSYDYGLSVTVDGSGNVYVAGSTAGSLEGTNPNPGSPDAFVRKYSSAGAVLWTRQFGSASGDTGQSLAVDGSGNVYVAGHTWGTLEGPYVGAPDAFVRKYSSAGAVLWTRQFGTASNDDGLAVAVDGSGNVYVAGSTSGALEGTSGGTDAFVRQYSSAGAVLWTRQFGTSADDYGNSVAVDGSGSVYVAGSTGGVLEGTNAGSDDVFVRKYSSTGVVLWTRQSGSPIDDYAFSMVFDIAGNAYVAAQTGGTWPGQTSAGGYDALLLSYAP